jgi:hypothetical protein
MLKSNCWIYQGKCLETPPEGFYGFIYHIIDDEGNHYWGKKAFTHKKKTRLSKKARVGTRRRIKVEQVDSKWLSYWGSCKPLTEYITQRGGTQGFTREIIKLCENRSSLTYWETAVLIQNNVLFRDDCWNGHVMSRFYKGKIHN